MTIHAAKGLEFPVVVVADLGRQGITTHPDLLVDGDRVGLRLIDLEGQSAKALDFEAIAAERKRADDAEERRVLHVALTRAEERLISQRRRRLGDAWPAPRPGGAADRLDGARARCPASARADAASDDVRERGAVRAQLNAPGRRRAAARVAGGRARRPADALAAGVAAAARRGAARPSA